MQLRGGNVAGLAGLRDHLAAMHRIAALDVKLAIVGVGRHVTIGVADQHEIAIALQRAAGIGDLAVLGGAHRGAFGQRDIDAVVAAGLKTLDDAAARRPAELAVRLGRILARGRDDVAGGRLVGLSLARHFNLGRLLGLILGGLGRLGDLLGFGGLLGLFALGELLRLGGLLSLGDFLRLAAFGLVALLRLLEFRHLLLVAVVFGFGFRLAILM